MRTITISLATTFLALALSSLQAQDLERLRATVKDLQATGLVTGLSVNGRYWNSLSIEAKATYIIASSEAMSEVLLHAANDCTCAFDAVLNSLRIVSGGSNSSDLEMTEGLDLFYKDSANRPIPVIKALAYVTLKMKGGSSRELEDLASKLRKDANP